MELNLQRHYVHLVVMIPPKIASLELIERMKAQTSMIQFKKLCDLKKKFIRNSASEQYCLNTIGFYDEMIPKHLSYQKVEEPLE